jgi:hypothetical protein
VYKCDIINNLYAGLHERGGLNDTTHIYIYIYIYTHTSLNPMPNAQVCVYLMVHITKLQLQTTFPKPLYIQHSACIHWTLAAENLDVCTACDL